MSQVTENRAPGCSLPGKPAGTVLALVCFVFVLTFASEKNMPAASASQKFAQLSDEFLKDSLVLSPTSASAAGYHTHLDPKTGKTIELDALLDDMSLQAIARQRAFYAEWRERFRKETPVASLDPEDAADWQLIDDQVGLSLLEYDHIQNYRHHPTVPVELIGNALFLPLSQNYASKDVRLGHALLRMAQIPRLLDQVKQYLGMRTRFLSKPRSKKITAIST